MAEGMTFRITGVSAAADGLTPLLNFQLEITTTPETEQIHAVMLSAQIHLQTPQRTYNAREREQLRDLFGRPEQWNRTLRNRLWALTHCNVGGFRGRTECTLAVPCSYDLNIATSKYFYALEDGEVPLVFLFSGTVFYATPEGRVQVRQISWDREVTYRIPVKVWKKMMEEHYPQSRWLTLQREVFDRLYAYKQSRGLMSWEQAVESLLFAVEPQEATA